MTAFSRTVVTVTQNHPACGWRPAAPAPLRAVLLDLDGTLVDSVDEFVAALSYMLKAFDLPAVKRETVVKTIGKGSEHLVRTVLAQSLEHAGRAHAPSDVQSLFDRAMELYFTGYEATGMALLKVYPGVREGIARLAQKGYAMAVVTNKPVRLSGPSLKAAGLAGFMAFFYGGDSFELRKPDPLPLRKACERLGVAPAQCLMVGDSGNDAKAARAAGCPVALLTYGYNHGEPVESAAADGYFDSIEAIAASLPDLHGS